MMQILLAKPKIKTMQLMAPFALRGLTFAGIKFGRFRGFRKIAKLSPGEKFETWPSTKLNPHNKKLKNKTNPRNPFFFKTNLYSLYSIQNAVLD